MKTVWLTSHIKENDMTKIRAHKTTLDIVNPNDEKAFLNENHYQGYVASSICYGLYYENELIELMSFGRPRFNKSYQHELLRLCTKKDYVVHGGASKLLKAFTSKYAGSIVSYCNDSLFSGKVYEVLGFKKVGRCKSYHYEKDGKTYNRQHFQKKSLVKRWPELASKTEKEIMLEKGYKRVEEWQSRWVLDDDAKYYIYKIQVNDYTYIGQHCYHLTYENDNYYGSGSVLKKIQKKYNTKGIKTILVDGLTKEQANEAEIEYIARDKEHNTNNVNIQKGGQIYEVHGCGSIAGNKGKHLYFDEDGFRVFVTDEEAEERNLMKGKPGFYEHKHSEESKRKMSEANKGNKYCVGRVLSLETKKKISESNKGKESGFKGKHHTEEAKRKLSELKKGKSNGSWWTNGIINKCCKECPEGFWKGKTQKR